MENEKKQEAIPSAIIEALKEVLSEFLNSGSHVGNFNLKIGHIENDKLSHFEELGIIFARGKGAHEICGFMSEFLAFSSKKTEVEKDHEDQQNLH